MWKSASASGSAWSRSSAASALIVSSWPADGTRRLGLRARDRPLLDDDVPVVIVVTVVEHRRARHLGRPVAGREGPQAHGLGRHRRRRRQVETLERAVDVLVAAAAVVVEAQQAQDHERGRAEQHHPVVGQRVEERRSRCRPRAPASASARASAWLRLGGGAAAPPRRLRAPRPIRRPARRARPVRPAAGAAAAAFDSSAAARRRASSAGRRVPGSAARAGASARRCPSRANRSAIRRVRSDPVAAAASASPSGGVTSFNRPGSWPPPAARQAAFCWPHFARRFGGRDARDLV